MLQSEILRNTEAFRYAKISEGFDHPLSPNEVIEIQQIIMVQLQMLDTPTIHTVHHKAHPMHKAIAEVRLISNMLQLFSGKNGSELLKNCNIGQHRVH